jgi:hypothetical protein
MTNTTTSQLLLLKQLRLAQLRNFLAGRLLWLGSLCIRLAKVILARD